MFCSTTRYRKGEASTSGLFGSPDWNCFGINLQSDVLNIREMRRTNESDRPKSFDEEHRKSIWHGALSSLPVDIRINRITSSSWLSNYRLCFMCSGSVGESESNALRCIMPMKVVNLVDIQTRMGMTAITSRSRSQQIESSFTKLWKFDCH